MRKRIAKAAKHPLITGSSLIFAGIFIANILNYFFNLIMGRLLSVSEYGLVATLGSLFILIAIFSTVFSNVSTKFAAQFLGSGEDGNSKYLLKKGSMFVLLFSIILVVVLIFSTSAIAQFLHVDNYFYIYITIFSIFFTLLLAGPLGYLQGRMKFFVLTGVHIFQPLTKFVVGIALVVMGFGVFGPLIGILMASALPLMFIYFLLKREKMAGTDNKVDEKALNKKFIRYSFSVLVAGVGMTLLSNTDIILVRHFFQEVASGQYAALSLMGKAIFYFTIPINFVFFPLIAYKKEKKERLFGTLLLAIAIIVGFSASLSFVYFAFPGLVLAVFFPAEGYRDLANYLGFYSLYILVFSVVSLLNSFFLSIGKTKMHIFTLIAAILQIILIIFFHNSLFQVIGVLFSVSLLLLVVFLLYYFMNAKD